MRTSELARLLLFTTFGVSACRSSGPSADTGRLPDIPSPAGASAELDPQSQAKAAAFAELVRAKQRSIDDERERARVARNERTLARHSDVVARGGYAKSVAERQARLVESIPSMPPDQRPRALKLSDLLADELARLVCAGPEIFFAETGDTAMEVHPGTYLILTGCEFGFRFGEVHLVLSRTGDDLQLTPRNWDPDTIFVDVPDVSGYVDQDARVYVITNSGKRSDDLQVEFHAARETQIVFGAYVSSISNPTHDEHVVSVDLTCPESVAAPRAWSVRWTLWAYHYQWGDLFPTNGRDDLTVTLTNQWRLVDWFFESSGWAAPTVEAGNVTDRGLDQVDRPDLGPDTRDLTFWVEWWVDRTNSKVTYRLAALVEGPRGTPYAMNPLDAGHTSAAESQRLWQTLNERGMLPGLPCE